MKENKNQPYSFVKVIPLDSILVYIFLGFLSASTEIGVGIGQKYV